MTIADTYDTGTVSVDSSGNVTGSGVIWSLVKKFDLISIDGGDLRTITEVTDSSHLKIQPWSGTASAKPYVIFYNSLLRLTNGELALRTNELVKTITGDGYFVYVAPADSAPDPAKGKDGQYALKPSTGATWLKASGVWNSSGVYGGLYPANNLSDVANVATARSNLGILSVPREVLTAARTYYVRTDGSNSNNGLANTSGGAFLTIQKAIDTAVALDLSIYSITINVADGTYTGAVVLKPYIGVGPVYITGNTGTPSNVVISTTTNAVSGTQCGSWTLQGMKIQSSGGHCVLIGGGYSDVTLSGVYFGASAGAHIYAQQGANISVAANYTISGNAQIHYSCSFGGKIYVVSGITVTLSGTPAFSIFTNADTTGIWYGLPTFSGSASAGTYRYSASLNGVIQTYGSGASYFPGGNAGVTATGGQYA